MPANQCLHAYFSKLNPVAEKIAIDIREVISAYDHVWLTLTPTQQDNIINDTIIKPEISVKYFNNSLSSTSNAKFPKKEATKLFEQNSKKETLCQKYNAIYAYDSLNICTFINQHVGLKILHDENIGDYRDEHSFPFSYKTKSQMNLAEIGNISKIPLTSIRVSPKNFSTSQQKALSEPIHQNQIISLEDKPDRRNTKYTESIGLVADEKQNLLTNFGSKNTLLSVSTDSNDFENDTKDQHSENSKLLPENVQMPKGFDFLSNW